METRAEILCTGSELLLPARPETNGAGLTSRLFDLGIPVARRTVLPDDPAVIEAELREALRRCDVVIVSGGIGPTEDDRTREAAARALGVGLRRDAEAAARLRSWARLRGRALTEWSLRQADLPEGAQPVRNEGGTAPGIWWERKGKVLVVLPGVPSELFAMWEREVAPRLAPWGSAVLGRRVLRTTGVAESQLQEWLPEGVPPGIARVITCSAEGVDVQLVGRGADLFRRLEAEAERTAAALGDALYGREEGCGLPEVVGRVLRACGETLATAESCTGGLLGHRITEVAGSSDYYLRGFVVYSNAAKSEELGVPQQTLREHGAVSEPVARALAEGAARHADWGIGITGIAGPGGGSEEKPAGTVHLAVARRGGETTQRRTLLPGTRSEVKLRASQAALDMLRRRLLDLPPEPKRG